MKTRHKVAAGGLSAAGLAASLALYNHWEWDGKNFVAVHLKFDPPGVITVCGGITNHDLPWLKVGMKFTADQCQKFIMDALPRYAAPISECVPSFPKMPGHRQGALTSFSLNLGPSRICNTSIAADLNAGRIRRACDTMRKYVYAAGKWLQGLSNRRNDPVWGERAWCLRED